MGLLTTNGGFQMFDVNVPNVVGPTAINWYSAFAIPAWYRAMRFLSDNLSSFPRTVRKDGMKRAAGEPAHPLERLLRRSPNPCQSPMKFWGALYLHAAHTGNGYAEVVRDASGEPAALWNLLPEYTCPNWYDLQDGMGPQPYFVCTPYLQPPKVLMGADVIHIATATYNGITGLDPVMYHRDTLNRASTLDRFQTRYLQKGTVIRGSIEFPATATQEQIDMVRSTIQTYFQGGATADRDVIVLSGGASLKNVTLSPQDSQLIAQGAYTTKQIAQITGVPPAYLMDFNEQKYRGSSEEDGNDLVRFTFRPWMVQIEEELSLKLLSFQDQEAGYAVHLDADALLRGDAEAVTANAVAKVNAGLATRNEGREDIGLPKNTDPESDKLKSLGDTHPPAGTALRDVAQEAEK